MATQLEEEKTASDVDFSDVDDSLTTLITNYKRRPLDRYLRPLQQRNECASGWIGKDCSASKDDCLSATGQAMCQNSNSCTDKHEDYECDCQDGWKDKNCDVSINDCITATGDAKCQNSPISCTDKHIDFEWCVSACTTACTTFFSKSTALLTVYSFTC